MSLVALDGTPLVAVGHAGREAGISFPAASQIVQDATNEACIMIGQVFTEDGASHTVDTSGSSSLGCRLGSVTLNNAGTTWKVGLAAVDTATGPPGRAANASDVVTLDVSKSYTSAAAPGANAWLESVPTAGTKTIANGDPIAFVTQMTARGGADTIQTTICQSINAPLFPFVTSFIGGTYNAVQAIPNAVITFSDGVLGFFFGGVVFTTPTTTQTWNSGSATKEYGNFLQMPVPAKVYGLMANCNIAGNADLILYSDPLGTPVAEKTVSRDLNVIGTSAVGRWNVALFSSPYQTTANQPLAAIIKPTTATDVSAPYVTFNAADHQKSLTLGANGYAVNRDSGAFAAQNSNKDRFGIGLLVGAFDNGAGGGGGVNRALLPSGLSALG